MPETKTAPRDELDDPLDDILAAPARVERAPQGPATGLTEHRPVAKPAFADKCPKCHGTGAFYSYNGRYVGPCLKCKGKGTLEYKTSPEERRKAREGAASRKARTTQENWQTFAANNEAIAKWILDNPTFEFATAMRGAVEKFGDLTERQISACQKCIDTAAARTAEREAQQAAASTTMDVSKLEEAFAAARANKAIKATLRTERVTFSLAKATGRNPGAIYAKRASGAYLGKIMDGEFKAAFECTPADTKDVLDAAADPKAAALRYAAITNACAICGILLTDPKSKEAGIGPICANKFGWGA